MAFWHDEEKEIRQRSIEKLHDILIVGGGIVGSALACSLKSNPLFYGKKVAVIENAAPPKTVSSDDGNDLGIPDLRVYTITPASKALFEASGVWNKINPKHVAPFHNMQVWDAMGDGFVRFDAAKAQVKDANLGYVVEHGVLQRALMARMNELSEADSTLRVVLPATVICVHTIKN
jgi:ubiquinone biosynthesis monooxygenase Coq6